MLWTKRILIFLSLSCLGACKPPSPYPASYETLSSDEAEGIRKVVYQPYQNLDWKKINSVEPTVFGLKLGQKKDESEVLLKSLGFQSVGGINFGMPYSCANDPCRCSKSRRVTYVRSQNQSQSFEAISLQYGPSTFDGICRSGLFNISSVDIYEKTKNAKN